MPINRCLQVEPCTASLPSFCRSTLSHSPLFPCRERDHGHSHSRPESSSRHTGGAAATGHHCNNSDPSAPKSDKKSKDRDRDRDRDRSSRESRPDILQPSTMPASDAAFKSPAPAAAAELSEPKSRSDRDRSGDRKRSSSSKQRQELKKADDSENVEAAVEDSQALLTEADAQAPKRVRRPVAASELAALNVDPKALESLGSDLGDNDDDETPKMMLRLRKRHDKDEKKEEHTDAAKVIAAPSTPDAHNREDGEVRPKV